MILFSRTHLLLRRMRSSLRPAGIESDRYHEAVAVQATPRTASQSGGDLIRKMRPFEEPHAVAFYNSKIRALHTDGGQARQKNGGQACASIRMMV
jgi:hypothetical protein